LNQQIAHLMRKEGAPGGTRYLAIGSGKGGVGKTILSLSFGKCLSDMGKRVLVVDGDLGLSNVHLMLGITPQKNLAQFLSGEASFEELIVRVREGFAFISSGNGIYELARLPKEQVVNLVRRLQELAEENYDFVIFDTPPGIHEDTVAIISSVDLPVIVTTPEPTAVADAYALIKIVNREAEVKDFFLVVNKVESDKEGRKVYESVKLLTERYTGAQLNHVGNIRYRKDLIRRIIDQDPFERGFLEDVRSILSNMNLEVALRRRSFWESIMLRLLRR